MKLTLLSVPGYYHGSCLLTRMEGRTNRTEGKHMHIRYVYAKEVKSQNNNTNEINKVKQN